MSWIVVPLSSAYSFAGCTTDASRPPDTAIAEFDALARLRALLVWYINLRYRGKSTTRVATVLERHPYIRDEEDYELRKTSGRGVESYLR